MIQLNIKQPLALLILLGVIICLPANAQDVSLRATASFMT